MSAAWHKAVLINFQTRSRKGSAEMGIFMNLEKIMEQYRQETEITPDEKSIQDTVHKAKQAFFQKEQERGLTYWEFLLKQLQVIRKRWWLLQILLLAAAEVFFFVTQEEYYIRRGLGVVGVLFIVLVIPELWKNRTYCCMEIEASSFYSLRQIYSARIFLFGVADVFLLTIFCGSLQKNLYFTMMELLIQFLFPTAVTACICFGTLCSRHLISEVTSVALCLLWSAAWWMITETEEIYAVVVVPVWLCLFGGVFLFLIAMVYKTLHYYNRCWEVQKF